MPIGSELSKTVLMAEVAVSNVCVTMMAVKRYLIAAQMIESDVKDFMR